MPRLTRIQKIAHVYPKNKHRLGLPNLLMESDQRCAYCLEHVLDIGRKTMEVDHFNPTLRHPDRNRHGNLLASSRHTNGNKSDFWPTPDQRKRGFYIIDPYDENDYGPHIIEKLATGELQGLTKTGRFHIEKLDLNADHLVRKRRNRTVILNASLSAVAALSTNEGRLGISPLAIHLKAIWEVLDSMIPPLPGNPLYDKCEAIKSKLISSQSTGNQKTIKKKKASNKK